MPPPRIILASSSPRRAKLLEDAGIPFDVQPADVDERTPKHKTPLEAAMEIATRKANAIKADGRWILAADTVVDHEGRVLGKPADELESHAMLRMLSGGAHHVITGIALRPPQGEVYTAFADTTVVFRDLTDEEIDAYIRTGDTLDKAGAYGIQGRAKAFVAKVEGPMDNVIGLPIEVVKKLLAAAGYPL